MTKPKHIVFFTPTLNRTGSEIVLLNLLKYAQLSCKITVITKFKGSLYEEIPNGISKDFLYGKQFGGFGTKVYNKLRKLFSVDQILKKHMNAIWYINTIALQDILEFAEANKVRTIVHIHELQQMYTGLNDQQIKRLVNYPELIIANSNASANVIKGYGRNKVEIIYPALNEKLSSKKIFADIRGSFNIPKDEFIWVMCGTLDRNKDPFLFVDIASELKKLTTRFKMAWIGGKVDDSDIDLQFVKRISEEKLNDKVIVVGDVKEQFYDHFAMANGFVLTSQFESFSMTTLEALFFGLPIVANDCIGVNEVIGKEFGYVVKQKNDPKEFAQKMFSVMNEPLPDKAKLKSRALEFDIKAISKKWNELLEKIS